MSTDCCTPTPVSGPACCEDGDGGADVLRNLYLLCADGCKHRKKIVLSTDKRRNKRLLEEHFDAADSSGEEEEEVWVDVDACLLLVVHVVVHYLGHRAPTHRHGGGRGCTWHATQTRQMLSCRAGRWLGSGRCPWGSELRRRGLWSQWLRG